MVENVRKAIGINELVPDSLTTSMVDDVFYVLQSCLRRAISTPNISSVVAVLSGASSLLNNEYYEALQLKIREPNLGAKLFLGGVGVRKTGTEIATALNNIKLSSEYVLKLKHKIEEQCAEVLSMWPKTLQTEQTRDLQGMETPTVVREPSSSSTSISSGGSSSSRTSTQTFAN